MPTITNTMKSHKKSHDDYFNCLLAGIF